MNHKLLVHILISIFLIQTALAFISFTTEQTEYIVQLNQPAQIQINVSNAFNTSVQGVFSFTVKEDINQKGYMFSSQNSHSQSQVLVNGEYNIGINLGTSDVPITRTLEQAKFTYIDPTTQKQKIAAIPTIMVQFVDANQQQNQQQSQQEQQNQQQTEQQKKQQEELQKQIEKQQQEMQEQYNQQSQTQKKTNAVSQQSNVNTNALKQQLRQEAQQLNEQKQQLEQQMQEQLQQNNEYQDLKKQLEQQGFTPKEQPQYDSLNEEFKQEFQNEKGETATISGNATNTTDFSNIQSQFQNKQFEQQIIQEQSKNNQKFANQDQELQQNGFQSQPATFYTQNNVTTFSKQYTHNDTNETITVEGTLQENSTIIEQLKIQKENQPSLWPWILLTLLGIAIYYYAHKYMQVKQEQPIVQMKVPKPLDFKKETAKLIKKAEKQFNSNKEKESYETLSYALRFYLSHYFKLKKELASKDVLALLQIKQKWLSESQSILFSCQMVEFAKGTPNKDEFMKNTEILRKMIN